MTIEIIAGISFIVICLIDVILVYKGKRSISLSVWLAERAHPTLIVGVLVLGVWLAYLTKSQFPVSFGIALSVGHLVTTEGASIVNTLTSHSRWMSLTNRSSK